MPIINLRSSIELTKSQRKALMERAVDKQLKQPGSALETQAPGPSGQGPMGPVGPSAPLDMPAQQPEPRMLSKETIERAPRMSELEIGLPQTHELAAYGLHADQIWRDLGGAKSMAGKYWELLAKDAGVRLTGRDYFISSFMKWKRDPKRFGATRPREANLLQLLATHFEESFSPGAMSPVPSIPGLPPRPGTAEGEL